MKKSGQKFSYIKKNTAFQGLANSKQDEHEGNHTISTISNHKYISVMRIDIEIAYRLEFKGPQRKVAKVRERHQKCLRALISDLVSK